MLIECLNVVDDVYNVLQKAVVCKKLNSCKIFITVHDAVMSAIDENEKVRIQYRLDYGITTNIRTNNNANFILFNK